MACGETLPAMGQDPADGGSDTSDRAEAGTEDVGADGGDGSADAAPDGPVDAGAACTVDLPFDPPELLENFDGLGAVSSVRTRYPSRVSTAISPSSR